MKLRMKKIMLNILKILFILETILLVFAVVCCIKYGKSKDYNSTTDANYAVSQDYNDTNSNYNKPQDKKYVTLDELPYNMKIRQPDSIGNVYGDLTVTNNSNYIIKYFELKVEYTNNKGSKDVAYYINGDTIMQGETSTNISTFISKDWKPISLEIKVYDKETNTYCRETYDYKLNELKGTKWTAYEQ